MQKKKYKSPEIVQWAGEVSLEMSDVHQNG
jgi:hypothetical protein